MLLEVRRGNVEAAALYESCGFETIGVRRGYYPDTGEDALVMLRECDGEKAASDGCGSVAGRFLPWNRRVTIQQRRC